LNAEDERLRPIFSSDISLYPYIGSLLVILIWGVYAYTVQLRIGLAGTGMNNITIWSVYIVNFIFFSGISLAGIGIAAAVRIMHMKTYQPLVRIAEVLTVVSLSMAGLSVVIDLGRPDRAYLLIQKYFERIGTSTMMWDITAVATYLILSATFLYVGLRGDLKICSELTGNWRKSLYNALLFWYDDSEKPTIHRLARILSITILPVMVMFHTVLAWIFGVGSTRPLWFGAVAGPYFVSAAVASGIGAIIVIAALLRWAYNWGDILKDNIFRGLGNFLSVSILVYLYFMLAEVTTSKYAAPSSEAQVINEWLFGGFAYIYWPMLIIGMILPATILIIQALKPGYVNVKITAILAAIVVGAFWVKRYIIIVPTLSLGAYVPYHPSWIEVSITAATSALFFLMYTGFVKIFPLFELEEEEL
jgi:Ni/Fe-hydrogenase subunit HybB-like protein